MAEERVDETLTPGGDEPFGSDVSTQFDDALFRTKKKHKIREVPAPDPALEASLADTHVHLSMLRDPARSIARAALHGVGFICCISNPASDSEVVYSQIDSWFSQARTLAASLVAHTPASALAAATHQDDGVEIPAYRIAVGCHPHDASRFDAQVEARLRDQLHDPRTCCVGEIGLDYHYDYSPRPVQRDVFRRQVALAHEAGLPVALHLREAHDEGLQIMDEEGFPVAGTILHCFNLGPDVLAPWVERGCYIAVGGAVSFGSSDELREALAHIPRDRFLFETDGPFMAPAPFRSIECGSDLIAFTAAYIAAELGCAAGPARESFLRSVYGNALELLDRKATAWQNG